MKPTIHQLVFLSLCIPTIVGNGTTTIDDFEEQTNLGGWSFNVMTPESIKPTEGNPGGWLRNVDVISVAPILTSNGQSTFTGDFRAKNVTRISIDARTDAASVSAVGRQFSLVLRDSKGTPLDPADDADDVDAVSQPHELRERLAIARRRWHLVNGQCIGHAVAGKQHDVVDVHAGGKLLERKDDDRRTGR